MEDPYDVNDVVKHIRPDVSGFCNSGVIVARQMFGVYKVEFVENGEYVYKSLSYFDLKKLDVNLEAFVREQIGLLSQKSKTDLLLELKRKALTHLKLDT